VLISWIIGADIIAPPGMGNRPMSAGMMASTSRGSVTSSCSELISLCMLFTSCSNSPNVVMSRTAATRRRVLRSITAIHVCFSTSSAGSLKSSPNRAEASSRTYPRFQRRLRSTTMRTKTKANSSIS
jgi:hypothetical protein